MIEQLIDLVAHPLMILVGAVGDDLRPSRRQRQPASIG
jgi:hypothetical protein